MAGAIWNHYLPDKLNKYLPAESRAQASKIYQSMVVAMKFPVGQPTRIAIDWAYRETTRLLAISGTAVFVLALVAVLFMKEIDLKKKDAELEAETQQIIGAKKMEEELKLAGEKVSPDKQDV